MHIERLALAASFLLLRGGFSVAQGQDSTADKPAQWLIGMSLGLPGAQHNVYPTLATFGVQFTEVGPGPFGGDFAIGTMPRLLANGIVPFGFRGDATFPLVGPHLILLPSAGVSAIGALATGGGGGTMGVNGGIAAVLRTGGFGLRTGISWHKFMGAEGVVWLAEVGFVTNWVDPP